MTRSHALLFSGFCLLVTIGCDGGGDKPPPYANVSGTVKIDGKPVEKGTITFSTDGRPPAALDIRNGEYSGQAMVGSNRVQVSAKRAGGASQMPAIAQEQMKAYAEGAGPEGAQGMSTDAGMVELVPPDWGTASKQMRVIEAGAQNKLDFDIRTK